MATVQHLYYVNVDANDPRMANIRGNGNTSPISIPSLVFGDTLNVILIPVDKNGYTHTSAGDSQLTLKCGLGDSTNGLLAYSDNFGSSASYGWTGSINLNTVEFYNALTDSDSLSTLLEFELTDTQAVTASKYTLLQAPVTVYNQIISDDYLISGSLGDYLNVSESDARYVLKSEQLSSSGWTYRAPTITETTLKVGIGTTNPSTNLHVIGNAIFSGQLTASKITGSIDNAGGWIKNQTQVTSEPQVINVGIGTDGPEYTLHVKSPAGDAEVGIDAPYGYTKLWLNASNVPAKETSINMTNAGIENARIISSGSLFAIISQRNNSGYLSFQTQTGSTDTERLRITNAGNIGIGLSTPSTLLHVNGIVSASSYSGRLNDTASNADLAKTASHALTAKSASYASNATLAYFANDLTSGSRGDIAYQSASNATRYVGIGSSGYALTSNGEIPTWSNPTSFTVGYALTAKSASWVSGSATSSYAKTSSIAINLNGGTAGALPYQSSVNNTSFVGIGSSNTILASVGGIPAWVAPSSILSGTASLAVTASFALTSSYSITSTTQVTASQTSFATSSRFATFATQSVYATSSISSSYAVTASYAPNNSNVFIQGGNSFGATAFIGTNDAQTLALDTNNITRLQINSAGNIGIGANPTLYRMYVRSDPTNTDGNTGSLYVTAFLTNTGSLAANNQALYANYNVNNSITHASNQIQSIYAATSVDTVNNIMSGSLRSLRSGLYFGKGTEWDLAGSIVNVYGTIQLNTDSTRRYKFQQIVNYSTLFAQIAAGVTGSVVQYMNYYAGQPSYTGTQFFITNSYGLYIEGQKISNVTNAWGIYQNGSSDINYFAGNVGIGTTNPSADFQVVGQAIITGTTGSLKGTASWADNSVTSKTASYQSNAFIQGGNSFGATTIIGTNDVQSFNLETSGSTRVTIDSTGKVGVGIGVSTPSAYLEVSSSNSHPILYLHSPANQSALWVSSSGYVGIGTQSPKALLHVIGHISSSAITSSIYGYSGKFVGNVDQAYAVEVINTNTNNSVQAINKYLIPAATASVGVSDYVGDQDTPRFIIDSTTGTVLLYDGTPYIELSNGALSPYTNGATNLGTVSKYFSNVYGNNFLGNATTATLAATASSLPILLPSNTSLMNILGHIDGIGTVYQGAAQIDSTGNVYADNFYGTASWATNSITSSYAKTSSFVSGLSNNGTNNYVAKWTGTGTLGTGLIQDDGVGVAIGSSPTIKDGLLVYKIYDTDSTDELYGIRSALLVSSTGSFYRQAIRAGGTISNTHGTMSNYGDVVAYTTKTQGGNIGSYTNYYAGGTTYSGSITTRYGVLVNNFLITGSGGIFPTGSIVNQYGISIGDLIFATNNYGLRSGVGNRPNTWNLYIDGLAPNYFAGNVGIGTTNPSALLHVNGQAIIIGITGSLLGTSSYALTASNISGLSNNGTANYVVKWTGTSTLGASSIYNANSYVGINTTPSYGFHTYTSSINVSDTIANYFKPIFGSTTNGTHYARNISSVLYDHYVRSEVTNSGYIMNVDVGSLITNTNHQGLLSVLYGMRCQYGMYNVSQLITGSIGTAYGNYIQLYNATSGSIATAYSLYIGNPSGGGTVGNHWGIYALNTDKNYFAGSIGIGTATPSAKLDIYATDQGTELLRLSTERAWTFRQSGSGATTRLQLKDLNGDKNFDIVGYNDSKVATFYCGTNPENSRVNLVYEGGKVGIGTTNPTSNLTVYTSSVTAVSTPMLDLSVANQKRVYLFGNIGGSAYNQIVSAGDSGIIFLSSSIDNSQGFFIAPWKTGIGGLKIDKTGKVGIGTATPSYNLSVHTGSSDSTLVNIQNAGGFNQLIVQNGTIVTDLGVAGSSYGYCGTNNEYPFTIRTDASPRIYVTETGLVGINTTSPKALLHVFGAISASAFGSGSFNGNLIGTSSYALTASNVVGGITNYVTKWTGTGTLGNSLIQDDGDGVTIGGSPLSTAALNVYKTFTTDVTSELFGIHVTPTFISTASAHRDTFRTDAYLAHTTGTMSNYSAYLAYDRKTQGGNITNFSSFYGGGITYSGSIDNRYGLLVYSITKTGSAGNPTGSITNEFGVYVNDLVGATNSYGIRSAVANRARSWNLYIDGLAPNYFNGNVGIGTTNPSYDLHVVGQANITGITGSLFGTSSWATNALTASSIPVVLPSNSALMNIVGHINGDGTIYAGLTKIDNVGNVYANNYYATASYINTVVSSSTVNAYSITSSKSIVTDLFIDSSQYGFGSTTVSSVGSAFAVESVATGSYRSAHFDYNAYSGSSIRAGIVVTCWYGSNILSNEVATVDIGQTNDLTMSAVLLNNEVILTAETVTTTGWTVKASSKTM